MLYFLSKCRTQNLPSSSHAIQHPVHAASEQSLITPLTRHFPNPGFARTHRYLVTNFGVGHQKLEYRQSPQVSCPAACCAAPAVIENCVFGPFRANLQTPEDSLVNCYGLFAAVANPPYEPLSND